ncbi:NAD-dependent epimerase/dehydratase family protein [Microbacterium murale]|uniref:2'-hydroxyisoflavone reductase n=1 Tax=Microbacterium murale TaxID=1081040 RepID=A0ABU0P426_9MICO|nr:NAD-dependent epimerase/dehydratase family protein [Microbacterium murale]MDQ0642092.1 2'-hydroxyisoflavone reductase [Microbacterium murale]
MTNVLVLGGTAWLSGLIATRWVDSGARVTCLARGTHAVPKGAALVRADRDDADPYDELHGEWDEIVDVSRHVGHARGAVAALGGRAARWTYVSSTSVYADEATPGADETAATVAPARDGDEYEYGAHKVASEEVVRSLGERARIVRPGLIVGPGDPSDRFGYWAAAFDRAADGPVLVPSVEGRAAQVIDIDDLVSFLVAGDSSGTVNAVGDVHDLGHVLDAFRTATAHDGEVITADDGWLEARGVEFWSGDRSLPLWLPMDMGGFMTRSNAAYRAAGGILTPLETTIARIVEDERARGVNRERRAGLTRDEESALLETL